jgi:hypothetical protein
MGKITVKLGDGSSVAQEVVDTNVPISKLQRKDIIQKFLTLSSALFQRKRAETIIDRIQRLEKLSDVRELTHMLVAERGFR